MSGGPQCILLQGRPLYLDFQATTPLDPRVLDAMMPFQTEQFGIVY